METRTAGDPDVPHVVIVGGGFGGLYSARALRHAPVRVTLVDRQNFHLFQPLLYQVATGGLSPANIATPLRAILRRQANADVVLGEVRGFDLEGRNVLLGEGQISYDFLVVASGAQHSYFGRGDWADRAPGLKTIGDATRIRREILLAFEHADRELDPQRRALLLSFAIIGAGPTGVELAGALAEIARHTLRRDFRHIDSAESRIQLIDALPRVLAAYPPDLSFKARQSLEALGVEVITGATVSEIEPGAVTIRTAHQTRCIAAGTVLWAAGVAASPLGAQIAAASSAATDRAGRVLVEPDFSLPKRSEVFIVGDLACWAYVRSTPLPGVAAVAMQAGEHVARCIAARVTKGPAPSSFRYRDRGSLATIGRAAAVGVVGRWHVSGFLAWLLWLFVHIRYLARAENRVLVLIQWAWSYFTYNRSARLITEFQESRRAPSSGPG